MKDDKKGSYFSIERKRRKRNIMIMLPIAAAIGAILYGLFFMSGSSLNTNQMVLHNHVGLNVTVNDQPVAVPGHIGMVQVGKAEDPLLYGNHSLDKYGMSGMSPLHTHDASGTIHVESNTVRNYTLGEFLDIWKGLNIDGNTVIATVNDKPVSEFRNIILSNGERIELDIRS
jgi:sulfur carrier protein ThiS